MKTTAAVAATTTTMTTMADVVGWVTTTGKQKTSSGNVSGNKRMHW